MESAFGRQSPHSARQSRSAKFYGDNGPTFRHTSVTTRDHRPGDTSRARGRSRRMKQREVGEAYEASTSALEAAKGQRLSLRRAIAALEGGLAPPPHPDGRGGADGL